MTGNLRIVLLVSLALVPAVAAQPPHRPWTPEEVTSELRFAPSDPYLQYVAAQLARRQGVADPTQLRPAAPNGRTTDLFATFTGAAAIQESLQLDTLRAANAPPPKPGPAVKIDALKGPTVQSHPWERLLGAKKPDVGPLANCVPADFYFAEFRTAAKLAEAATAGDLYGNHVFSQVLGQARSGETVDRIKAQLGLGKLPAGLIDRLGVEGVAVVGSDLYLGEGSDVTILVRGPNVAAAADLLAGKLSAEPGTHTGIAYRRLRSADGATDVYVATPTADLHVRGSSLPAFLRVLECVAGKTADGRPVVRLGETAEFRYVRSLMPRGGPDEDGFVYLSDAFVRRQVGPQVKLAERRRLLAYNHLRMIGHACLMFRTEFGRPPASLKELAEKQCAPGVFGEGSLAHPDGGTYTLAADGTGGVCSRFGTADRLTPCLERPVAEATAEEAAAYTAFVKDYEQYWRTYFDPIAVRVRVTPADLRLETLVLPLIDNSIYTELARALKGKPTALDTRSPAKSCIGSLFFQVNKEPYLAKKGDVPPKKPGAAQAMRAQNDLKQLALAMHNYESVNGTLPTDATRDAKGKPLLSWRVAILPYIEQNALYLKFKLDEPWDSPHNKALLKEMPATYRGPTDKLNQAYKTVYKVPVGKGTIFPAGGKGTTVAKIADGTSNTILILTVADEEATEWTKPDEWAFDPAMPTRGLARPGSDSVQVAMADGSVTKVPLATPERDWAALFTKDGGEPVQLPGGDARTDAFSVLDLGLFEEFFAEVDTPEVRRFVADGLGDQIGFHMFDESRLLDFDFATVLGGADDNRFGLGGRESLGLGMLLQFFIRPVAVSVPVKEAKLVDEMLDAYDRWVVEQMGTVNQQGRGFLPFRSEFYRANLPAPHAIRCATVKLFGFKVRWFWGRIGDALYLANRPFILEDVAAAAKGPKPAAEAATGNAVLRVRPENWNRVLPGYRLGWAENDRAACQANFSRMTSVGRGWDDRGPADAERVARVYGGRPVCPEGGRYTLTPDGRDCLCSVHGSRDAPTQPAAPTRASATGRLTADLSAVTAALTFQDDGLRAVLTIRRDGRAGGRAEMGK